MPGKEITPVWERGNNNDGSKPSLVQDSSNHPFGDTYYMLGTILWVLYQII